MKHAYFKVLFILLFLSLAMPQRTVYALAPSGGVNVFTTLPELICVGDSLTLEGAAGVDYEPSGPGLAPLVPLVENAVQITAMHGKVSPSTITHIGDFNYFSFTYTATSAG
ncbi:MAG: hypothetical protein ABSA01_16065, partial [Anaerolineales bacterium]